MSEQDLNPELGDFVTIVSIVHGTTTGRIVIRDETLLRVKPVHEQLVKDFPIGEDGLFDPSLGVTAIFIKEKRTDPHFSIQLNTIVGDEIELFDVEGRSIGQVGKVTEIIATEDMDALKLDTGKYLNFRFVGPKPAIGFLVAKTREEEEPEPEQEAEQDEGVPVLEGVEVVAAPDFEFNPDVIPYEDEEEEQFTYSDAVQRQDMFTAFMDDIPVKRQKDPKVSLQIFRMTDVFLALKNSVVVRDGSGSIKLDAEPRSYTVNTVQDALEKATSGNIPAILPVANVKKVLYVDEYDPENVGEDADVSFRQDLLGLYNSFNLAAEFEQSTKKEAGFLPYVFSLFKTLRVFEPKQQTEQFVETDQDVLRSKLPLAEIDGFPQLPPLEVGKNIHQINNTFLGSIQNQYVRLLGPSKIKLLQKVDRKTTEISYTVAQADTADVVGNIILSEELTQFRQSHRSSVLLWDIVASERSRRTGNLFFPTLEKRWADQHVMGELDSLTDILADRLKSSLAFINAKSTSVIDSFGLRNLELSQELFQVLFDSTQRGQAEWDAAFPKLKEMADTELAKPHGSVFPNMVEKESPLFSRNEPLFQERLANFLEKHKYSNLKASDLALADELVRDANYTGGPFWYSLASGLPRDAFPYVETNYTGELERAKHVTHRKRELLSRFAASPDINPCVHVKKYERLRSVKDDEKRMILFNKFLQTYNGGKMGNYVQCNVCNRELCCMHEVLMLNEFMNVGQKDTLHKALLLEFAGPAFEGNYICRVCGQKIREIEYSTSIEFDDEGKPMVGRTVIDGEDVDVYDMLLKSETDEKQAEFPFKGDEVVLYTELNACFQACGMDVNISTNAEMYVRAVEALKTFKSYLPSEEKYEKGRKGQLDTLKGEKKRKEFERQFPPFSQYYANAMIGCIGALAVLEFQTSSISVPNPVRGCAFSLSGYPIDDAGSETIEYVTCAIVTNKLAGQIYNAASWSLETNMKKLAEDVQMSISFALDVIMQKKKAPTLSAVTAVYGGRLQDKKRSFLEDLPSVSDMLPASFRPLQQLPRSLAEEPVKNVAAFQSAVTKESTDLIAPVVIRRQHQLNNTILETMHAAAKKDTVANTNNPRSDGAVSFMRLANAELIGRGYNSLGLDDAKRSELDLVNQSRSHLRRKDPTFAANGTHIFVPWSAPTSIVPVPEVDVNILYKLFLKYCFHGPYEGYVHELGPDYVCRRCEFAYPTDLLYLTSSELSETNSGKMAQALAELASRREAVILARFKEQGVEINASTFSALDEKVRSRKILPPAAEMKEFDMFGILEAMGTLIPDAEGWALITSTLLQIKEKGIQDEIDRKVAFGDVSSMYDTLIEKFQSVCETIMVSAKEKPQAAKAAVAKAITGFVTGTENPFHSSRNLLDMFAVGPGQIANGVPNVRPNAKKWFPSINYNHLLELEEVWSKQATVVQNTIQSIESLGDDDRVESFEEFGEFSKQFGQCLRVWSTMKPNPDLLEYEYTLVTRWITLTHLLSQLENSSRSFIMNRYIVNSLIAMSETIEKYQLTDEQIQIDIAKREEKERNFFINKIDVLDGELKKVELMKKKLGLGDWNVNTKNLFSYNSDWWDHERDQRAAMGILPEFAGVGQAEEGGLPAPANPYSDVNDHRVAEHEDE